MESVSAAGRVLTKGRWRAAGWPCVDIRPYDPAYFQSALKTIADEFGIALPEITEAEPEERGGSNADFVIGTVQAGAYMNGQRCSIAVDSEETRDRIYELLTRLET